MGNSQVRARIIEVGHLVKQALIERGVGAAATEPAYKYVDGEVKRSGAAILVEKAAGKWVVQEAVDELPVAAR